MNHQQDQSHRIAPLIMTSALRGRYSHAIENGSVLIEEQKVPCFARTTHVRISNIASYDAQAGAVRVATK